MRSGLPLFKSLLLVGALGACAVLGSALPSAAQNLRDYRVDLYPMGQQVGIVTSFSGTSAWVRLPSPVRLGATVEFMNFSDSSDTLATGQVRWVAPVAPYEAYITLIKPKATRHPRTDFDDDWIIGPLTRYEITLETIPSSDPFGAYLATGTYVRASVLPVSADREGIEPVRAYIRALRDLKTKTATDMAVAAESALVADPFLPDVPAEYAVNYTQLSANLRAFRRLDLGDSIAAHILKRLEVIAQKNGGDGANVSKDILHYTAPLNGPQDTGAYGGLR